MIVLSAGDKVYVHYKFKNGKSRTKYLTVRGFTCYGILFNEASFVHFCAGLFYGFGYHKDGMVVIVKDESHIKPALAIEKVRRSLTLELSKELNFES